MAFCYKMAKIVILIISIASLNLLINQSNQVEALFKSSKEISRKSIVFDIKTPKVFYCIQEKQSDFSKTIVKAKALEKLCEFGGNPKPKHLPSDCFNDVDETEFACEEKKRFLMHQPRQHQLRLEPKQQSEQANNQAPLELDYEQAIEELEKSIKLQPTKRKQSKKTQLIQ